MLKNENIPVSNIEKLNDIKDVSVPSPTDGYFVYWDDATQLWKCKELNLDGLLGEPYEVQLLSDRAIDEWWKNMDGWTQVTANGGSDSFAPMKLLMETGSTSGGRVARYTDICRPTPQMPGHRAFIRMCFITTPSNAEIRFYAVHVDESFNPLSDIEEHGGFKIIDGNVYASNANGTTETATDTEVDGSQGQSITFEMRGQGSSIEFYVNTVLKATHTTNLPTEHATNYCYCIEIKNTAATNRKIRADYVRHKE